LYASIHTTYPANYIEITDIVPQIQQFKRITNQIFHSFTSAGQMFQSWLADFYS